MSSSSSIFNGNSRYSSDFQAVISRAVAIASLPITQMSSQRTTLTDQSSALDTLDSKFTALQTALSSLGSALGPSSLTYSVSDAGAAKPAISEGAYEGTYTLEVLSIGSYVTTMSNDGSGVSDPDAQSISTATTFTLAANGGAYTIQPAANTLRALADAVNASGAEVQASIVNVGTASAPDYRLSVENEKLGPATLQLTARFDDGTTSDLLAVQGSGTPTLASYRINGRATAIESDTRTVTLGPGLTVELLNETASGSPDTIKISRSTSGVSGALQSFANAYNAALDELDKHRGQGAGSLSGNGIVQMLGDALRRLTSYTDGSDTIGSLTGLGLSFNAEGRLTFDAGTFSAATADRFTALSTFLGDSGGSGFLKAAGEILDGLESTTDGTLKNAITSMKSQIASQDERISDAQARVDLLEQTLQAQMAQADALIASLEQQVTYFNSMFQSMQDAWKVYK